jgi:eukaryotic-like serine/threonine-protein kinase
MTRNGVLAGGWATSTWLLPNLHEPELFGVQPRGRTRTKNPCIKNKFIANRADNILKTRKTRRIPMPVDENSTPIPKDRPITESPLDCMLHRIRRSREFPGISKYISSINQELASNPDSFDASELADMILNDYALTSKLLRLANSVTYNFAAGKVTTVSRAVVVLGYVYVRLISISLSLFEHFKSKHHMADLKEEMICSLWSGMLAREIAIKQGDSDSEEAFICAMLIRLGKMVMIRYFPDEYRKILRQMQDTGCKESKAVKSVCATTYEALCMAAARQWNFPEKICKSLLPLKAAEWSNRDNTLPKFQVLNSFIRELNKLSENNAPKDSSPLVQNLLDRYVQYSNIPVRQLRGLIRASVITVEQHAQALDFDIEGSPFLRNLRAMLQIKAPSQKSDAKDSPVKVLSENFQLTDATELKAEADGQTSMQPIDIILDGVQEISQAMIAGHDIKDIAAMSLEILYRSLGFHRALMFVLDGAGQKMVVQSAHGRLRRQLLHKVHIKIENAQDFFDYAIQSGKDLIVSDVNDPDIGHLVPPWYRSHIDAPAFIFLPVSVQNATVAALYADRSKEGRPITDAEHRYLNMLRNQLALAFRYRPGKTV